jgi:hypothetical protein
MPVRPCFKAEMSGSFHSGTILTLMGHAHPDDQDSSWESASWNHTWDRLPHWAQPRVSQHLYMDMPTVNTRRWATSRRTAAMSRGASPSGRGVSSEVVRSCWQVSVDQMLTASNAHMYRISSGQITLKSFGAPDSFKPIRASHAETTAY